MDRIWIDVQSVKSDPRTPLLQITKQNDTLTAFHTTLIYLHKTTYSSIVLVIRITSNARDILNDV